MPKRFLQGCFNLHAGTSPPCGYFGLAYLFDFFLFLNAQGLEAFEETSRIKETLMKPARHLCHTFFLPFLNGPPFVLSYDCTLSSGHCQAFTSNFLVWAGAYSKEETFLSIHQPSGSYASDPANAAPALGTELRHYQCGPVVVVAEILFSVPTAGPHLTDALFS